VRRDCLGLEGHGERAARLSGGLVRAARWSTALQSGREVGGRTRANVSAGCPCHPSRRCTGAIREPAQDGAASMSKWLLQSSVHVMLGAIAKTKRGGGAEEGGTRASEKQESAERCTGLAACGFGALRMQIDVHVPSSLASSVRDGIYASVNRTKPILHGERAFGCILESRVRVSSPCCPQQLPFEPINIDEFACPRLWMGRHDEEIDSLLPRQH